MRRAPACRPAAIEQLVKVGERIGVPVFEMGTDAKPAEIARRGLERALAEGYDAVIVDTAGRLQVTQQRCRGGLAGPLTSPSSISSVTCRPPCHVFASRVKSRSAQCLPNAKETHASVADMKLWWLGTALSPCKDVVASWEPPVEQTASGH